MGTNTENETQFRYTKEYDKRLLQGCYLLGQYSVALCISCCIVFVLTEALNRQDWREDSVVLAFTCIVSHVFLIIAAIGYRFQQVWKRETARVLVSAKGLSVYNGLKITRSMPWEKLASAQQWLSANGELMTI